MGIILGTAAYMSPEQARGKPVDKRADIWAFGVVLYEMLTGRRAFEGEDVSSILAAVIQSEPRWDGVPASVRRLLESCLEKDPKKRLRDIGDVWKLLDDQPAVPTRTQTGILGWAAAGLLALLAAVALWAPWRDTPAPAVQPVLRLEADLGNEVSLVPLAIPTFSSVVISPDGTRLVYVGTISGGPPKLLTRRLDQPNATELAGTEGAMDPFFSRDGQWVAFWTGREIYKVPVDGGGPVLLGEVGIMTGGDWDDEGNLVIGTGAPSTNGVLRLPPTGGAGTPMLELANGEMFHTHPQILPGGKAMLLQVVGTPRARTTSPLTSSPSPIARARHSREESGLLVTCRVAISCTRGKRRCSPCRSTSSGWKHAGLPSRFLTTSRTTRLRMARSTTCHAPARSCTGGALVIPAPPCSGSIRQASRSRSWPGPARMLERPACRPMASASRSPFRMAAIRTSGSTSPSVMR